jgi:ribosomal protein S11
LFELPKYKQDFFYLKVRTLPTNFFITLTDYKHEVIIYRSTGHVSENRKKKNKNDSFYN